MPGPTPPYAEAASNVEADAKAEPGPKPKPGPKPGAKAYEAVGRHHILIVGRIRQGDVERRLELCAEVHHLTCLFRVQSRIHRERLCNGPIIVGTKIVDELKGLVLIKSNIERDLPRLH